MKRRSLEAEARIANVKRLGACLAGGFVLALMVGTQEGTQSGLRLRVPGGGLRTADLRLPRHRRVALPRDHVRSAIHALPDQAGHPAPRCRCLDRSGVVHPAEVDRQPPDRHREVPPAGECSLRHRRSGRARPAVLRIGVLADAVVPADHRDGARSRRDDPPQRRDLLRRCRAGLRARRVGGVHVSDHGQVPGLPEPRHWRSRGDARVLHDRRCRPGVRAESEGRG